LERALLCGPLEAEHVPGYSPDAVRAFSEEFVRTEEDQAVKFKQFGVDSAYQERVLTAREWALLMNEVAVDALARAGLDSESFLSQGADFLTDFLSDMPVVHAQMEMRRLQHQNPSRHWQPNDHNDVIALSMAVVHCDVVVTEKHWAHLLTERAALDKKHSTLVVDRKGLPELLIYLLKAQH